jgi:hypothetical protein
VRETTQIASRSRPFLIPFADVRAQLTQFYVRLAALLLLFELKLFHFAVVKFFTCRIFLVFLFLGSDLRLGGCDSENPRTFSSSRATALVNRAANDSRVLLNCDFSLYFCFFVMKFRSNVVV